jgi:hypothetical protein
MPSLLVVVTRRRSVRFGDKPFGDVILRCSALANNAGARTAPPFSCRKISTWVDRLASPHDTAHALAACCSIGLLQYALFHVRETPMLKHVVRAGAFTLPTSLGLLILYVTLGAQTPAAPRYKFDPDWPKPLPNKWKMGGVTGLAVDKNDDVWVLNRPNDLTEIELHA